MSSRAQAIQTPVKYQTLPTYVQAMLFTDYHNGISIIEWLDAVEAPGLLYMVPQGYEHHHRHDREMDRSNGHVLDDAPAFMVLKRGGITQRIDKNCYLYYGDDMRIHVMDAERFEAKHLAK